jgi:ribonuclease J
VLKDLKVPVYGSRLTMGLLKGKLKEHNLGSGNLHDVSAGDTITAGPFKVEFIHVSHSIPDSMALAIHTPVGVCLHTGDFKIDMSPIDNQFMDLTRISELGQEGVLLLMADSTNVERPGFTASEKSVGQSLDTIFLNATGRLIVTTFASNVHRIQQAIWAAERIGRKVAVVGRGMNNVVSIANELGYLKVKANTFIDINDIKKYPDRKLVILTTGSQGETLAGLTRMSTGEHRQVHLHPGDLVVISANPIPGNEKMISRTVDNLYHMGVDVAYGRSLGIHVSGHASQEDLKLIFNLVRPKFFMPVHGEYRMLCEHGKLATHMGLPAKNVFIMENGQVLELSARSGKVNGKVHSGQVLIDGRGIGDVGTTVLKDRKQLSNDGIVIASIVIDRYECRLNSVPYIFSRGFVYEKGNDTIFREAEKRIVSIVEGMSSKDYNQSALKASIKQAIARLCFERTGRKPIIVPIINEI